MEKTDDEFSAGLITLGREYIELERGLRAEREKNEKAHQEMVEKCERQQAEAEYYCQGMSEMLDAACGEYRRREEELQKERAAHKETEEELQKERAAHKETEEELEEMSETFVAVTEELQENEKHCQVMFETLTAVVGVLQKERAAREEDHQNCSALQRENKNMVAAVIMGGLIGSALRSYGPTWWKGLRRSLDTWWQPPPDEPSLR